MNKNSVQSRFTSLNSRIFVRYLVHISTAPVVCSWFVTGFADASKKITSPPPTGGGIVVFGTNLTSTVGVKFTRKQLAMVQLGPYQYSVIIGLLLSDG
jgi:hypothetical protein